MSAQQRAREHSNSVRRPTIRDVARGAGVSTTTVSDALNGRGRLPSTTRQRVAAVARRLGYTARASARRLREGRTGQIAIYGPLIGQTSVVTAGDSYYLQLAMGLAEACQNQGLTLLLLPPKPTPGQLNEVDIDGLVVADPVRGDPGLAAFARRGIPIVTCSRDLTPSAKHAGCVETDDIQGLTGLLDHLADRGAERIALISPGADTAWGENLAIGYEQWCVSHKMSRQRVVVPAPLSPETVERASEKLLSQPRPADAIISAFSFGVLGVLRAAQKYGLRVPRELLVASCVDSPMMETTNPPITAIDLQAAEMGRRLSRMLSGLLDGSVAVGAHEVLPTKLIVRESTGHRYEASRT